MHNKKGLPGNSPCNLNPQKDTPFVVVQVDLDHAQKDEVKRRHAA